jgi:hypothetical protein
VEGSERGLTPVIAFVIHRPFHIVGQEKYGLQMSAKFRSTEARSVRSCAVMALGELGSAAEDAVPTLESFLKSTWWGAYEHCLAAEALQRIKQGPATESRTGPDRGSPTAAEQIVSQATLRKIKSGMTEDEVIIMLGHPDSGVRSAQSMCCSSCFEYRDKKPLHATPRKLVIYFSNWRVEYAKLIRDERTLRERIAEKLSVRSLAIW